MGYTHYWKMNLDAPQNLINEAVADCNTIVQANADILAGWDGETELEVSETVSDGIAFNGQGSESHETFAFPPSTANAAFNATQTFDFCKTAMKPYDIVVVACLAAIQDRMGDTIEVSSDGYSEDWEEGVALASKLLEREIPTPLLA